MTTAPVEMGDSGPASATLANWRLPPYNRWSFQNVDTLLPCRTIAAGQVLPLAHDLPLDLREVEVKWRDSTLTVVDALAATYSDGFMVLRDGKVLCEVYGNGDPASRHILFSVSKSVTGALAGVLAASGELDPRLPVVTYVPEAASSAYGDCTVQHVLDMTVDIQFVEDYLDPKGDFARYRSATGWNPPNPRFAGETLHGFIGTLPRGGGEHGASFHYVSPNSDLLGWILERAAGAPFDQLLSRLIWQPMGAEQNAIITVDHNGAPRTAGGICTSLRDLARFGELMRNGGAAGGKQIIARSWIDDILHNGDPRAWQRGSMAALFPSGRYRSQWYVPGDVPGASAPSAFMGSGFTSTPRLPWWWSSIPRSHFRWMMISTGSTSPSSGQSRRILQVPQPLITPNRTLQIPAGDPIHRPFRRSRLALRGGSVRR